MRDRFGAIPQNVETLFGFVQLRQQARQLGVVSIVRDRDIVAVKFHPTAKIDPERLLALLAERPDAKFSPGGVLALPVADGGPAAILEAIEDALTAVRAGREVGASEIGH